MSCKTLRGTASISHVLVSLPLQPPPPLPCHIPCYHRLRPNSLAASANDAHYASATSVYESSPMTRYIAFLRAINVGGHTVKMDHLRQLFESLGFSEGETFLARG